MLAMTKLSISILGVLYDCDATAASKSISIHQILPLIPEKQRKTYGTIYRHCKEMINRGYMKNALDDGASSTFIITDSGTSFYKSQIQ